MNNFNFNFNDKKIQMERRSALHLYLKTGKNPFENLEKTIVLGQENQEEKTYFNIDATASWNAIQTSAKGCTGQPVIRNNNITSDDKKAEHLLNIALNKAANLLSQVLDTRDDIVKKELLILLKNNLVARKNIEGCIRFFRYADKDLFTECSNCGSENSFPWDECLKCGATRE